MKRNCFVSECRFLLAGLVATTMSLPAAAYAQTPSIEGTYQLISRTFADGTVISPPEISGLWTYSKSRRNLNILRKDATGKGTSRHLVSIYKLSATEYSETLLFHVRTDQIGGKENVYEVSGKTQSMPVKTDGGRLQFKLPFEPPTVVFEGNKITAGAGGFVDVWEKVE